MPLSSYTEGKLEDHLFGIAAYTAPTLYLAASTADPTSAGTGLTEPSGLGYTRVATAPTDWSRAGNVVTNASVISFPQATGAWGTIAYGALMDASTAGNMILDGALTTAKAISNGDTLQFPIGSISFTLN